MSIRVEWLDEKQSILCCTPQRGWTWEESHRLLEEWVRPLLANAKRNVAVVADLRNTGMIGGDSDLLLKRLQQLTHDSMHAKAFAVVGLRQSNSEYVCFDSLVDATQRINYLLR